MRLLAPLVLVAGVAAVVTSLALFVAGVEAASECNDECRVGGVFWGVGVVLFLATGLGLLIVGTVSLTQIGAHRRGEANRYLAQLRARVPPD